MAPLPRTSSSRVLAIAVVLCISSWVVVGKLITADLSTPEIERGYKVVRLELDSRSEPVDHHPFHMEGSNRGQLVDESTQGENQGSTRLVFKPDADAETRVKAGDMHLEEEAVRLLRGRHGRILREQKAEHDGDKVNEHSKVTGNVAPINNGTTSPQDATAPNENQMAGNSTVPVSPVVVGPAKTVSAPSPVAVSSPPPPVPVKETAADKEESTDTHGTCDGPVIGKLQATGEDGTHDYALTVQNVGGKTKLDINITTKEILKATPEKFVLGKTETKQVTITVIDRESANLGSTINISWGEGGCEVVVPPGHIPDAVVHPSFFSFLTLPGTGALIVGGTMVFILILAVAGIWGCISWRAHAQRHGEGDAKYQELEMSLPSVKKEDETSPSADGWDEVWEDDDWEDTEAVRSSSSNITLSAQGLNSRRANKDGWDSSWDD